MANKIIKELKKGSESARKQENKKRIWLGAAAAVGTAIVVGLIILGIHVFSGLPSLEELENPKPNLASKVYSIDGVELGQYFIENRIEVDLDSVPDHFIDALIATEDRKFYDHWGVDVDRFVKAMIKNIFTFSREGASTITQQLAKNLYKLKTTNESIFETGIRKIREWITAIQIEQTYTKREILELYLNVSYFGRGAYGVQSAALTYFDKNVHDLTIPESAVLIALLKSPVNYDPVRKKERSLQRRNLVIYQMYDADYITRDEMENLRNQPIVTHIKEETKQRSIAPHFVEYVRQQMERYSKQYDFDLYRDGLTIYTTLDAGMQEIANEVVGDHLTEFQKVHDANYKWSQNQQVLDQVLTDAIQKTEAYQNAGNPNKRRMILDRMRRNTAFIDSVKDAAATIQAGFVVMDPHTGHIKSLVGGENQEFAYGLNHVTQIKRQPGSSFKPIVYVTMIEAGYSPAFSVLNDRFTWKDWSPNNSNEEYGGYMSLRNALRKSVNIVAARLIVDGYITAGDVVRNAQRMGIMSDLDPVPAIALGATEVTPLELVNAIGTIANHGVYVSPISILRIEDKNGMVVAEFDPVQREAVSPEAAAIVTNMMQDVINAGTGASVRKRFHRPAAGKTGTTNDFADAWFIGFTPQYVAGAWVGFDDRRVQFKGWYGQGARAALPMWAMFMERFYKKFDLPLEYFDLPYGVITVSFCKESIQRGDTRVATEFCPETVTDVVLREHMPLRCNIHTSEDPFKQEGVGDSGW